MKTKNLLLVIGVLGVAASVYGALDGQAVSSYLTGLICGACLIYGYFELGKAEKQN